MNRAGAGREPTSSAAARLQAEGPRGPQRQPLGQQQTPAAGQTAAGQTPVAGQTAAAERRSFSGGAKIWGLFRPAHRSLAPSRRACLVVATFGLAAVVVRLAGFVGDRALENVITLICGFGILVTLLTWFFAASAYSIELRGAAMRMATVLALATAAVIRPDGFSGDIFPRWRFFWQLPRHQRVARELRTTGTAAALRATPIDFPQFQGPRRNLTYDQVELAGDWTHRAPREVWRRPIGAGWSGFVTAGQYAVTMEQRGPNELVTCYELHTGKAIWASGVEALHRTSFGGVGPRSTPAVAEGFVVALGATGILRCLDGERGATRWRVDLTQLGGVAPDQDTQAIAWGRAASPLVVDGRVIAPLGGPLGGPCVSLAAFDLKTGRLLWKGGGQQVSYSSPIVATLAGRRQLVIVNEDSVAGHAIEDGRELWRTRWDGDSAGSANTSQPVPIAPDALLLTKGYNQGARRVRLERREEPRENGREVALIPVTVWESPKVLRTKLTSAVVDPSAEVAYGLNDGLLECVDLRTGGRNWKRARLGHGQLLKSGPLLLVLSEYGDLHLLEVSPQEAVERGVVSDALRGICWNHLCLHGRFLLIRNAEEAACYELPLRGLPAAGKGDADKGEASVPKASRPPAAEETDAVGGAEPRVP